MEEKPENGALLPTKAITPRSSTNFCTTARCRFGSAPSSSRKYLICRQFSPPWAFVAVTHAWTALPTPAMACPTTPLKVPTVPIVIGEHPAEPVTAGAAGSPGLPGAPGVGAAPPLRVGSAPGAAAWAADRGAVADGDAPAVAAPCACLAAGAAVAA